MAEEFSLDVVHSEVIYDMIVRVPIQYNEQYRKVMAVKVCIVMRITIQYADFVIVVNE